MNEGKSCDSYCKGSDKGGNIGRVNGTLNCILVRSPKELGNNDGKPHRKPGKKGYQQEIQNEGRTDSRQGFSSDKVTDNNGINQIICLLQDVSR